MTDDPESPVARNEQSPLGEPADPEKVMRGISEKLGQYEELDGSHIEVTYEQGVVILSGTVRDDAARKVAEEATMLVPGVIGVDNDLELAG